MDAQATAKGARILADLRTIESAATIYQAKTGNYPNVSIYGTGKDLLTTDDPAHNKYQLLASWPVPPTGRVIFPCQPNKPLTFARNQVFYSCNYVLRGSYAMMMTTSGVKTFTAAQLAEGGSASW